MKQVSILVPKGNAVLSSVVGPYKVFKAVNQFLKQTGNNSQDFFDVRLVGIDRDVVLYDGAFSIHCDAILEEVSKTDLILIPAFRPDDLLNDAQRNKDFVPWIIKQRSIHKAEVASLCMGAFILAETGLLNGKTCATHWAGTQLLRKNYPEIQVLDSKLVTEDDGIYTSGGAYSFLNLMLHLVEKFCGRETAIYISKLFEIEIDRENQHPFAIFKGQKDHTDSAIKEAQGYIEKNVSQRISVEHLANKYAISRRNFARRFKKATQNTPLEYIQRVKMEAAKKSLESTQQNIMQVMFAVGYSDQKAFRTVFKKYVGLSPIAYKGKYNRSLVKQDTAVSTW